MSACSCSFGGKSLAVPCCRNAPHTGYHSNAERRIRWADAGGALPCCTWTGCADPSSQLQNGEGVTLHLCAGGFADLMFRDALEREGWT